ncbi:RNase H domain protein [Apiospora marii]|uniref:Ribonuclease H n=1 Tax=Apiospora marii TaxID=335849 RepID=A0ABR1RAM5_9PEZI
MVSKKRKADAPTEKFYAVRCGKSPGVYGTWAECQAQTAGYAGAKSDRQFQDKSFVNFEDAEAFVAGISDGTATDGTKQQKFYAVAIGRDPGIYTDWDVAAEAIKGWKGPKYKKFDTRAEAVEYIRAHGNEAGQSSIKDESMEPPAKKSKRSATSSDSKRTTASSSKPGALHIYTDGSSLANGSAGAVAGVGVFFGSNDPRNVCERLEGEPQTNQRAELTAILRALEQVSDDQDVRIFSDSKYSISCVTEWYINWEKNGWKTGGKPVKNKDLVELVREKIDDRDALGTSTLFQWIKGHADDPGNVAADNLAVLGARS